MSSDSGSPNPPAPKRGGASSEPTPSESVGRYLARQRRLRSISVEELARLTKIPARSIERLEAGHFDGEADGFVRGFVRTLAEALGLDPDDTVNRMLTEVQISDPIVGALGPALRAAAVLAAAALLVALIVGGFRSLESRSASGAGAGAGRGSDEPEIQYRRDPVRSLAEVADSQGAEAAGPGRAEGSPRP